MPTCCAVISDQWSVGSDQYSAANSTLPTAQPLTLDSADIERDAHGTIIGVDLARARSSVNDEVLNAALTIPGLKKLRVAGNGISRETLVNIGKQTELEELYLQDTMIHDDDLAVLFATLQPLKRLTLRRCMNVTDAAAESLRQLCALPETRRAMNLALIEMNLGRKTLEVLSASPSRITALDLRDCSRLAPEDYALLRAMPQLTDLKIGGFGINDVVLESVGTLPNLTGLTIEDAMITPGAFSSLLETAAWRTKLTQLVLSRNMTLPDNSLLAIQHLPNLKRLTTNDMTITGRFLISLAENEESRPRLETLSLQKTLLSADSVKALLKYRELKSLNLTGVALSEEMNEALAALDGVEVID